MLEFLQLFEVHPWLHPNFSFIHPFLTSINSLQSKMIHHTSNNLLFGIDNSSKLKKGILYTIQASLISSNFLSQHTTFKPHETTNQTLPHIKATCFSSQNIRIAIIKRKTKIPPFCCAPAQRIDQGFQFLHCLGFLYNSEAHPEVA